MQDNTAYTEKAVILKSSQIKDPPDEAKQLEVQIGESPDKLKSRFLYRFFKRLFDIFFSLLAIIVLSPVFLLLTIAIRVDSEGKAMYSHNRIGHFGKIIKIYKFRSMVHNANEIFLKFTPEQRREFEINFKLDNDPRITKMGAFIRKTSLDELPQLWNILKGDLSIVGPRPVVEYEIYKYSDKADKFLSVKPGLTGYWQANGRSSTSYEERVNMDMFYIDNCSFLFDLKIIFSTVKVVLLGKGAV